MFSAIRESRRVKRSEALKIRSGQPFDRLDLTRVGQGTLRRSYITNSVVRPTGIFRPTTVNPIDVSSIRLGRARQPMINLRQPC
jgi:hypothetical protein